MKIIASPRQMGKTTKIISEAIVRKADIIAAKDSNKELIKHILKERHIEDIKVFLPVEYLHYTKTHKDYSKSIVMDDADVVLNSLFKNLTVVTMGAISKFEIINHDYMDFTK